VLQALLTTLNGSQQNRGLQGGSHGAGPQEDPIETGLIEALGCLEERPNFHEIVSTTNDYNQTLAHLSILYDYPSLLGRLVEWHIELSIADVNGLTALHCAYMKGDMDSVRSLRRGGASETVTDQLGRTPSELLPEGLEGFDSDIDLDAELAGLDAEVYPDTDYIDEKISLVPNSNIQAPVSGGPGVAGLTERERDRAGADPYDEFRFFPWDTPWDPLRLEPLEPANLSDASASGTSGTPQSIAGFGPETGPERGPEIGPEIAAGEMFSDFMPFYYSTSPGTGSPHSLG